MFKNSYILKNIVSWNLKTIQDDNKIYDLILLRMNNNICLKYKYCRLKQFCFNENIRDYVFAYQPSLEFLDFKTMLNTFAKNKKYVGDLENVY